MAYSYVEMKNFKGLYLQPNTFAVPDGALEIASNAVIAQDGVIAKRRGLYTFHTPASSTLNNLFLYQSNLLALLESRIDRISSVGAATTLGGETVSESGRTGRAAESNNNLYFTSNNGVMKLTSYDSAVSKSGIPPALDLRGQIKTYTTNFLTNAKQVGYRVVFGQRDANKNLLLGAPSDFLYVFNTASAPRGVRLEFSIPTEITSTEIFYQIYRTSQDASDPLPDYRLIRESQLTSGEITAGVVFFNDTVLDVFRDDAAELYTNPNSREGELQANERPPLCDDIVLFKDQVFYANSTTKHFIQISLIAPADIANADYIEVGQSPTTRRYVWRGSSSATVATVTGTTTLIGTIAAHGFTVGISISLSTGGTVAVADGNYVITARTVNTFTFVANTGADPSGFSVTVPVVGNETENATSAGTTTLTATRSAHGFLASDVIYVSNSAGGTAVTEGEYTLSGVTANTFTFTANVGAAPTSFDVQGLRNAAGYNIAKLMDTGTVGQNLDTTARALVKAINRDDSSPVYARYLSSNQEVPGQILLQSKTFDSDPIQLLANTVLSGGAWSPPLPTAFGSSAQSENEPLPNVIYVSKIGEPEAVPVVNQIVVGSRNAAILRIFALRDSLIVLKEDGVFRIDGNSIANFEATIIDNTVFCLVASSAALLNNQVYFLSNQGICLASSTNVEIISRQIELPIQAVLGAPTLAAQTSSAAYESERLYMLTTIMPNTTTANVVYVYNTITQAWTTWDTTFKQALVGPLDRLFTVSTANVIKRERKDQNKLDYSDESYATTVVSVAANNLSAVVTVVGVTPVIGDILALAGSISRIRSVTSLGANNYTLVFENQTGLDPADTPTLYRMFTTIIKTAPFHAGSVGRSKQFSQFQVHSRDKSISTMSLTFATDSFGSSEQVDWRSASLAGADGWGNLPWGFFPWGLDDGINLTYNTQPAPIVRVYIPLFAQRSTFIQPYLEHKMAAEPLNVQSFDFAVRGYAERVSR